jgi:hypothetical protein
VFQSNLSIPAHMPTPQAGIIAAQFSHVFAELTKLALTTAARHTTLGGKDSVSPIGCFHLARRSEASTQEMQLRVRLIGLSRHDSLPSQSRSGSVRATKAPQYRLRSGATGCSGTRGRASRP